MWVRFPPGTLSYAILQTKSLKSERSQNIAMERPHETPEERERAQIARFSQYVLSPEAWFRIADELEAAMKLLEPQIERFWECLRADACVVEKKDSEPAPKHSLINVNMMLAGFAIENLCKGYLAGGLSWEEKEDVKLGGKLPQTWRTHEILELVLSTGLEVTDIEKDLLKRIGDAIWRGRYPGPTSHKKIEPFVQWGGDVPRIRTVLQKLRAHVGAKDS
jgi:hypothetical protein